jgi:hypothetical protein
MKQPGYSEESPTCGAVVINRTDDNYHEMVDNLARVFVEFSLKTDTLVSSTRKSARDLSQLALWEHFIAFYEETYTFALQKNKLSYQTK